MIKPNRLSISVSLSSALAFSLLAWVISAHHGPLTSLFGQIYYLQSAAQIWAGNGYMSCQGQLVSWIPPGYSSLLVLTKFLGLPLIDGGRVLGVLFAGAFAGFSTYLILSNVRTPELAGAGILFINLNPIIIKWHLELTSDSLHATAVLGFLALLLGYMASRHRALLFGAAVAAALAALTRFIGVAAVLVGTVYLLFLIENHAWKRRLTDTFLFGAISSLPLGVFVIINKALSDTVGGGRSIHLSSPTEQLREFLEEVSRWITNIMGSAVRDVVSEEVRIAVLAVLLVAGAGVALLVTLRWNSRLERRVIWMPFVYAAVYFVMMVVLSSLLPLDDFSGRYVLPLLAPMLLWGLAVADTIMNQIQRRKALARLGLSVAMLAILVIPAKIGFALASGEQSFGNHQAAAPMVRSSPLLQEIRLADKAGDLLADDAPTAQFLLTHLDKCFPVAKKDKSDVTVVSIDAVGIETGTRQLAAPRISFSRQSRGRDDAASANSPLGTVKLRN